MTPLKLTSPHSVLQHCFSRLAALGLFMGMAVSLTLSNRASAQLESYQVTFGGSGIYFFAVHLWTTDGNNYLGDILPSGMPDGSALAVFDNGGQVWSPVSIYSASLGVWDHPFVRLRPGQGAFLSIPPFIPPATLTIMGHRVAPGPAPVIPPGKLWFVSSQTDLFPLGSSAWSYEDIFGTPPLSGITGFKWDGGFNAYQFDQFGDGMWDPAQPSIALSQAMWFSGSSWGGCSPTLPTTTIETQPQNLTAVCGQPFTLTATVNGLPGLIQVARWRKGGQNGPVLSVQPVTATYPLVSYTIPSASSADSGDYWLELEVVGDCNVGAVVYVTSLIASLDVPCPVTLINSSIATISALTSGQVLNAGSQKTLLKALNLALTAIASGNANAAKQHLKNAIKRTDGCDLRGTPDTSTSSLEPIDWITVCPVQVIVYAELVAAYNAL